MKINSITKKILLLISLAMVSTTYQTQAAPIEHIGDRYIMHLPEMELTGEESLLDVLMMCPEVISIDGNNIIGGDPFANLYGKFVIRIDNQEYGLDYATFLHHFKAREIETIQVCQNAEVMKGCSSLKKVIDITLRKKENGTVKIKQVGYLQILRQILSSSVKYFAFVKPIIFTPWYII